MNFVQAALTALIVVGAVMICITIFYWLVKLINHLTRGRLFLELLCYAIVLLIILTLVFWLLGGVS